MMDFRLPVKSRVPSASWQQTQYQHGNTARVILQVEPPAGFEPAPDSVETNRISAVLRRQNWRHNGESNPSSCFDRAAFYH